MRVVFNVIRMIVFFAVVSAMMSLFLWPEDVFIRPNHLHTNGAEFIQSGTYSENWLNAPPWMRAVSFFSIWIAIFLFFTFGDFFESELKNPTEMRHRHTAVLGSHNSVSTYENVMAVNYGLIKWGSALLLIFLILTVLFTAVIGSWVIWLTWVAIFLYLLMFIILVIRD